MSNLRIPGPTPCPPEVLEAMSWQMINHRGPQFAGYLKEVTEGLKTIFQTKNDVFLLSSSGTGGLESAVVNTLSPGDKVLGVSIGVFGERFATIAKTYGAEVVPLNFDWGKAADADAVADALELKKRSLDDREKAVAEREALADEKEKKVTDLQKKYEDLEKSVNAEIAAAVQTAKDGTQKSAQIAANILKANTDADMRIATAKIETLEAKVVELQKQLDKANELVAKANTQVSDMAQSALKAQGDVNTISKVSEIAAGSQKKS